MIIKSISKVFSGVAVYSLYQLLLSVLIGKLYGTQALAEYFFVFSLIATVFFLTNLGLRQLITSSNVYSEINEYFTIRLMTSIIALLISFTLYFNSGKEEYSIFITIFLLKLFESVSEINYAYYQRQLEHSYQSRALIGKSILSIIAFITSWKLGMRLETTLLFVVLANLFSIAIFEIKKAANLNAILKFKPRLNYALIRYSIPLGLAMFIINLNINFPRIISGYYLDDFDIAIIGASIQLALAGSPFITGITQALLPTFRKMKEDGDNHKVQNLFLKTLVLLALSSGISVVLLSYFSKELLAIIYNAEISKGYSVFNLILIGAALNYMSSITTLIIVVNSKLKENLLIE